ncbi:MAG: DNA mismatch repair protein, partial [Planctomycetota bacterium]
MIEDPSGEPSENNRPTEKSFSGFDWYASQKQRSEDDIAALTSADQRFATIRLALFAVFVLGFAFAVATQHSLWGSIAGISFMGFLFAVIRNESVRQKLDALRANQDTLNRLMARCQRDWESLDKDLLNRHQDHLRLDSDQTTLSRDLDLFGRTSLFSLVSMAGTQAGAQMLGTWLSSASTPKQAEERHRIAALLAENRESRLSFYTRARQVGCQADDPSAFVRWAVGPRWLENRTAIQVWPAISSVVFAAIVAVGLSRGWDVGFGSGVRVIAVGLIVLAIVNLILAAVFLTPIAQIFATAIASRRSVGDLQSLLDAARP